jgi:hypothetical protein
VPAFDDVGTVVGRARSDLAERRVVDRAALDGTVPLGVRRMVLPVAF